jgi:ribosomal protein S14
MQTTNRNQVRSNQQCVECGDQYPYPRYLLGYKTCLQCGEQSARLKKHTIAPLQKSNYILIRDPQLLKQLNKYQNQ